VSWCGPLVGDTTVWYRGTSLIRNSAPQGPYSRNMHRVLWWSWGGELFRMREVPLYMRSKASTCLVQYLNEIMCCETMPTNVATRVQKLPRVRAMRVCTMQDLNWGL